MTTIGTHNGVFHLDELMAIAALRRDNPSIQVIADEVDRLLIQQVDAEDNGMYSEKFVGGLTLYDLLGNFNPTWQETSDFDAAFMRALDLASVILDRVIINTQASIEARDIVLAAATSETRIITLPYYVPWQATVIEEFPQVVYLIHPAAGGGIRFGVFPTASEASIKNSLCLLVGLDSVEKH